MAPTKPIARQPYARLCKTYRLLKHQLPDAVELSLDEIKILIEFGVFPPAKCHPIYGPSWNATKINAWAWGLRNSRKLAERVAFVLGYWRDDWAGAETATRGGTP